MLNSTRRDLQTLLGWACLALLPLAGCQKEEAARAEAPQAPAVHSLEPALPDHTPQETPIPPLRRTALSSQDSGPPELPGADIPQESSVAAAVRAIPLDNGVIRLVLEFARPDNGEAFSEELRKAGLEKTPPARAGENLWTRNVAAEERERTAFERLVLARIEAISQRIEHFQSLALRAREPGRLVWLGPEEPAKFLPGRLVYTGHPLDIALADAGSDPHLFFAVEGNSGQANSAAEYVRGGRLFVAEDWTLRLGGFKPAGEWPRVPAGTARLAVRPDCEVLAFFRDGTSAQELGLLRVARLQAFKPASVAAQASSLPEAVESVGAPQPVVPAAGDSPLRTGHLEYGAPDRYAPLAHAGELVAARQVLAEMLRALNQPFAAPRAAAPPPGSSGPIVIHKDLTWTEQHLKALGVPVERTPGHTVIPLRPDPQKVVDALAKVLQVLRLRMDTYILNLKNADVVRDAENRLNPYRRKVIKIGPQGEAIEEVDPSPFRKIYKPGDPNADADGNVTLPNVNSAVETADFQAAAEEYTLVRSCMERLAPQQIFPDPPPLPQKPEGR